MSRYIDADELTEFYEPYKNMNVPVNALLEQIKDTPTADVVEVVRCKDCKYYKEYVSHRGSAMMCFCPCSIGGQGKKKPDDYCSYGERNEVLK